MKTGLSLSELAAKIEGNRALKQDFIAPTEAATMQVDTDGKTKLEIPVPERGLQTFPILRHAHDQIGARLQIPAKYYDRMLTTAPDLLATNVNAWFRKAPEKRMVRTLGGDVRAFLSNRYNRIENEEIAEVVLPILGQRRSKRPSRFWPTRSARTRRSAAASFAHSSRAATSPPGAC